MKYKPRFYLGGKYEERGEIKKIALELVKLGCEWTCDWTKHTGTSLSKYAEEDINGVLDADFVIIKKDKVQYYKGTWVEIGAALANSMPVYVVGVAEPDEIFLYHPLVRKFETFRELFNFIRVYWLGENIYIRTRKPAPFDFEVVK